MASTAGHNLTICFKIFMRELAAKCVQLLTLRAQVGIVRFLN